MVSSSSGLVEDYYVGEFTDEEFASLVKRESGSAARAAEVKLAGADAARNEGIAVVGISGFFPGARSIEEFYEKIESQASLFRTVPSNHLPEPQICGRYGAFLDDVALFDAEALKITPREAEYMDPRQRLLLMSVWHTLEDACYLPAALRGSPLNVYVASEGSPYSSFVAKADTSPYTPTGVASWSLPNRISHVFGFKGKSTYIDTSCSGSSVALHEAVQSLRRREADYAIVGAANVFCGQDLTAAYWAQESLGILADARSCHPFQGDARGFLPAEGVVTVLLKRLSDAKRDKDNIHAVILGSHVNHAGGFGTFTMPSPDAQSEAIVNAYLDAGIDPSTVTCVEAHGASSLLADAEEIKAFKKADEKLRARFGSANGPKCKITTIKPNLGHANAASGLMSLTRVICSLKKRKKLGVKDFTQCSQEIDLRGTRFYIDAVTEAWPRLKDERGAEIPRRAAINNFGAGGVNAHLIIEEHFADEAREEAPSAPAEDGHYYLPLSALHEEQVVAWAAAIFEFLRNEHTLAPADLEGLFVVARQPLRYRFVFRYRDLDELKEKLTKFVESGGTKGYYFKADSASRGGTAEFFQRHPQVLASLDGRRDSADKRALFELWANGIEGPVDALYQGTARTKRSLPRYPFKLSRYWVEPARGRSITAQHTAGRNELSPLLQTNTSTLSGQRFRSVFSGDEFFLNDHQVKRRKVLPGVAYLEMAHEALRRSWNDDAEDRRIRLKNVIWARPIVVDERPAEVSISLAPRDADEIAYEISGEAGERDGPPLVYSQGTAEIVHSTENAFLDLAELRRRIDGDSLAADACYRIFESIGLDYGPGHRGLETLYTGNGEVLAKLSLPASVAGTLDRFTLHPGLLDSALQAAIGLRLKAGQGLPSVPWLPFALEGLEVLDRCTESMWAWVRYSGGGARSANVEKLDIELCDDHGKVRARLRGFTSRAVEGNASDQSRTVHLAKPVWREKTVAAAPGAHGSHHVLLCGMRQSGDALERRYPAARFTAVDRDAEALATRFEAHARRVLELLRASDSAQGPLLVQLLVPTTGPEQLHQALCPLSRSAQRARPDLTVQVIGVEEDVSVERLTAIVAENSASREDELVRYENGKRLVLATEEIASFAAERRPPWKERGVYLITGGLDGASSSMAREIAARTRDAIVLIAGDGELGDADNASLDELERAGVKVVYERVDLADERAVRTLVAEIETAHGSLNGVIHRVDAHGDDHGDADAAVRLGSTFRALCNLDQATRSSRLDFLALCSGLAASEGAMPRDARDEAQRMAEAVGRAFCRYRGELAGTQERRGQTVSLLYTRVAPGAEATAADALAASARRAVAALSDAVACGEPEIALTELAPGAAPVAAPASSVASAVARPAAPRVAETREPDAEFPIGAQATEGTLAAKTTAYLRKILTDVTKLPPQRIRVEAPLEHYGIDSIMVMQLTNELEKVFGSLPKTLFFEYQTLEEVSRFFLESYRPKLAQLLDEGVRSQATASQRAPREPVSPPSDRERAAARRFAGAAKRARAASAVEPVEIAIIGLSGRYPQAGTIEEYWENLKHGRDCITAIPKERAYLTDYFASGRDGAGSTEGLWGGFIDDVDRFDPQFFNITPREAEIMDPQERLFLECAYAAIEDAGYTRESLSRLTAADSGFAGNVGVFVGVMYEEYQLYGAQAQSRGAQLTLGGNPASIANRVSYFCNFRGPSMAIDTMCSSSLAALHLACESIRNNGCDIAIAGGVNVSIHANKYLILRQGGFVSSKGRCESFGEGGDGYIPAEGVGAVLLKRKDRAVRDGDRIYGVIRGSALNHGGKTNGYTVPNPAAQEEVISKALDEAGVDAREISYIEAHGTGTSLGDPIEIAGLVRAFNKGRRERLLRTCAIGSVKSNIGHCESAAGISGVTKVLLQMKHRQLVPSLHSKTLNPYIDFANSPFTVQQELAEWKRPTIEVDGRLRELPRIAGVSGFGAGGSNAHVVIEEYAGAVDAAGDVADAPQREPSIVVLSAKGASELDAQARNLVAFIDARRPRDAELRSIAYTLQVGREAMAERLGLLAHSVQELRDKLVHFIERKNGDEYFCCQVKQHKDVLEIFSSDDDMRRTIDAWIEKRKYGPLVELWVKGLEVDWTKLYGEDVPSRMSLPTYPFLKKKCWLPPTVERGPGAAAGKLAPDADLIFSRPAWKRREATAGALPRLTEADAIVVVTAEDRSVDAKSALKDICFGATVVSYTYGRAGSAGVAADFREMFLEVFRGVRSHLQRAQARDGKLILVTDAGEEAHGFRQGLVGFFKSVQKESGIAFKSICVGRDLLAEPGALPQILGVELAPSALHDTLVRYLSSVQEREVGSGEYFEPQAAEPARFADDDLFWVTGGNGKLALLIAERLIRNGVKKIYLLGRSAPSASTAERIEALARARNGVSVEYCQADVCDAVALEKTLAQGRERRLNLKGIVHTAGVIDDALIERKTEQQALRVLSPKVHGVENLDRVTKDEQLEYFVLFSSMASVHGNVGQCDYAAANGFMDGFATYRRSRVERGERRGRSISINWPHWEDGGMSLDPRLRKIMTDHTGMVSLSAEKGLFAFDRICEQTSAQVLVAEIAQEALKRAWIERVDSHASLPRSRDGTQESPAGPLAAPSAENERSDEDRVLGIFSEVTRIPVGELQLDQALSELGLDSILLMQLVNEIQRQYPLRMYVAELQKLTTVRELIRYVVAEVTELVKRAAVDDVVGRAQPAASPEPAPPATNRAPATQEAPSPFEIASVVQPAAPRLLPAVHGAESSKVKNTVFVLGTPRGGSTLLRVMLNGNPRIFSPPELYLLNYGTMAERSAVLESNNQTFLKEGLIDAIATLTHVEIREAKELLARFERDGGTVRSVYEYLHSLLNGRLLVDKTPNYSLSLDCLRQAERHFDDPVYIYLYRHPLSVMGSLVKNRFDKMLGLTGDPWETAEGIWRDANRNIRTLLHEVPAKRQIHIPYEALVTDPEVWMRYVCDRLGIEFAANMIHPYQNLESNMVRGLHLNSVMIGDPNFLTRNKIDPQLAFAWKADRGRWNSLQASTKDIAGELGYSIDDAASYSRPGDGEHARLLPAQQEFLDRNADHPLWVIVNESTLAASASAPLRHDALRGRLVELLRDNPILRTAFTRSGDAWVQRVTDVDAADTDDRLEWIDGSRLSPSALATEKSALRAKLRRKIDVAAGSSMAVAVIALGGETYFCCLMVHHLVADGFSLARILDALFNPEKIAPVRFSREKYLRYLDLCSVPSFLRRLALDHGEPQADGVTCLPGGKDCESNTYRDEAEFRTTIEFGVADDNAGAAKAELRWEAVAAPLYRMLAARNAAKVTIAHRFHRREFFNGYVDDIGYYAGDLPVSVARDDCDDLAVVRARLIEARSKIVAGGVAYEILANKGSIVPATQLTGVRLNYQPLFGSPGDGAVKVVDSDTFLFEPDDHVRPYDLDCVVRKSSRGLLFVVRYNENRYAKEDIASFVEKWIGMLDMTRVDGSSDEPDRDAPGADLELPRMPSYQLTGPPAAVLSGPL